jgi:hypothetical protein
MPLEASSVAPEMRGEPVCPPVAVVAPTRGRGAAGGVGCQGNHFMYFWHVSRLLFQLSEYFRRPIIKLEKEGRGDSVVADEAGLLLPNCLAAVRSQLVYGRPAHLAERKVQL